MYNEYVKNISEYIRDNFSFRNMYKNNQHVTRNSSVKCLSSMISTALCTALETFNVYCL